MMAISAKRTAYEDRVFAEVMSSETGERYTLYVKPRDSQIGETIFIKHTDGEKEPFTVVGILEARAANGNRNRNQRGHHDESRKAHRES